MILTDNVWSIACYVFLWTGTMLAFFHSLGKYSLSRQLLKRAASGFAIKEAHIFVIHIVVSSCPRTLLGSNDFIIFKILPGQFHK